MAALIMVRDGSSWQASGGLFEWTLDYLIPRVGDEKTAEWLRTVVDDNLGQLWLPDLPPEAQDEIRGLLVDPDLLTTAELDLPDGPAKPHALSLLQELIALAT
jgi:hypothetical protein